MQSIHMTSSPSPRAVKSATCSWRPFTAASRRRAHHAFVVKASSVDYRAEILACETDGNWLRCFELYTEANALKVALPVDTMEATIRTFSQGGQWQRAVDLYDKLQSQGSVTPSSATVSAVVVSLSQAGQSQRAEQLLTSAATSVKQQHAGDGAGAAAASQALVPAWNTLLRAMAKSGDHLQALVLLERLVLREEVAVFDETFAAVALAFVKAGDVEKAEEVLELRDY